MTNKCKCGGKLRRTDIKAIPTVNIPGGYIYVDEDSSTAHWKCLACGAIRTQRKRQSKKEQTTDSE